MYNKIIQVNVSKEKIEILNEIEDVNIENSVNYIKLEMTFNDIWNEFEYKYVVFKNGKTKVKCLVGDDNSCYVPSEVIKVPNFSFSLLIENDVQRITTNVIYVPVEKTISLEDVKDKEETQLLYNQINTLVNISKDNIKELEEYIKNMKVQVDLSEVLAELDILEDDILNLQNKIDNLHIDVDVDLQPILDKIETSQTTIQGQLGSISTQMSVHYSDLNTSISNLKLIVDKIPTSEYTDEIKAIKDIVDGIPTNDYTSDLNTIKNKIDTLDFSVVIDDLNTILNELQNGESYVTIKRDISDIIATLYNSSKAGTIANNTKWSLTRAEECKSISQQIYQLLTDVSLQLDEF